MPACVDHARARLLLSRVFGVICVQLFRKGNGCSRVVHDRPVQYSSSPFVLPGKRSAALSLAFLSACFRFCLGERSGMERKYGQRIHPSTEKNLGPRLSPAASLSNNGRRKGNEITNSASKLATDRVRARTTASQAQSICVGRSKIRR